MNAQYQTLLSCLDRWSTDASPVVSGNVVVFDDFPPTVDAIYDCLFAPSNYDDVVVEILTVIFSTFSALLTVLLLSICLMENMMLQMYLWLEKQNLFQKQTQSVRGILHNLIASSEKNLMLPFCR